MRPLLGLHVGTRRADAIAIDAAGKVMARASADYRPPSPTAGTNEQDPGEWWSCSRAALGRVAAAVGGDVAAVGITGQPACVFLDHRGEIVRPAPPSDDPRVATQCEGITRRIGRERLIDITGNPASAAFQAPQILWLRDVEPVQYRHARRVLAAKDYVRLLLTGEAVTDLTEASGTLLLDLGRRRWSIDMISALEIVPEWLPSLQESSEISGGLRPSIATDLGLPAGTPVAAGATMEAAAAVGRGAVKSGLISASIGDEAVLLAPSPEVAIDSTARLSAGCFAWQYQVTGRAPAIAAVRWWGSVLGGQFTEQALLSLATSTTAGQEGLFFVPATNRPLLEREGAAGRGAFVGLRAHHSRADLTRAVIDGTVLNLRRSLDRIRELGIPPTVVRASGGGPRNDALRHLQADIFNLPVQAASRRSHLVGAALLGGVAAGVYSTIAEAIQSAVRLGETIDPDPQRAATYERLYRTFIALEPAIGEPATR